MAGKVVIITGAGRGLGKAFAIGLSRQGYRVVAAARKESELEDLSERLETEHLTMVCDITKLTDCQSLVEAAYQEFGHVDVLINNAGIYLETSLVDTPADRLSDAMDVVIRGSALMSKLALDVMAGQKSGHIISILDTSARYPLAAYNLEAPHSVDTLLKLGKLDVTNVLRREAAASSVKVTSFFMNWVASDIDLDDPTRVGEGVTHPADAVRHMLQVLQDQPNEFDLPASI